MVYLSTWKVDFYGKLVGKYMKYTYGFWKISGKQIRADDTSQYTPPSQTHVIEVLIKKTLSLSIIYKHIYLYVEISGVLQLKNTLGPLFPLYPLKRCLHFFTVRFGQKSHNPDSPTYNLS